MRPEPVRYISYGTVRSNCAGRQNNSQEQYVQKSRDQKIGNSILVETHVRVTLPEKREERKLLVLLTRHSHCGTNIHRLKVYLYVSDYVDGCGTRRRNTLY